LVGDIDLRPINSNIADGDYIVQRKFLVFPLIEAVLKQLHIKSTFDSSTKKQRLHCCL